MQKYIPYIVYDNLIKLLEYRGAQLVSGRYTSNELIERLNHHEFCEINGVRRAGTDDVRGEADIRIILIAPNSVYATKSGDFKKKIIKQLPVGKIHMDILFVSKDSLTKHIKKYLVKFKAGHDNLYIEDYDYTKFMQEMPMCTLVPRHYLANDAEIEHFCRTYHTSKDKFNKILTSDTMAVWLGLRPGMCVRVVRPSETAGTAPVYRYCV